jgi:predicted transglutaminase-like cysteine proteinase
LFLLAFTCVGSNPIHAGDLAWHMLDASPQWSLVEKWQAVQRRMVVDEARLGACRVEAWMCSDGELRFEAIVAAGRAREGRARIGEINRAVNLAIRPVSDERRFGVADRWSSPLETIDDGAGDCEDYAIIKLLALREAGVASSDLKLLIVRDLATRSDHALVAARLNGRWLLLDNRRFALVDLEFTQYRLLARLDPEIEAVQHASADTTFGASWPDVSRDIM